MSDSLIAPRVIGTPDPGADFDKDPELAGLLDFDPAPRKVNRPDGWSPERQRRFIQLIVETGSPQRAAVAMGKVLSGVEYVYRGEESEGFRGAWDRAVAIVRIREERRLARLTHEAVKEPPHRRALPPPTRAPVNDAGNAPASRDEQWEMMLKLFERYARKLQCERRARRAGDIAAADFYLRQATWMEVCLEVGGLQRVLEHADIGGTNVLAVAETPLSRILDDIRRAMWSEDGERPERPDHLLVDHGDCSTEPGEVYGQLSPPPWADPDEWRTLDHRQQRARYAEQRARDAEAYRAWIERATAAWDRAAEGDEH
jgi:hypothetical protein